MSITAAELICYASANRPTADTTTSGGAIDLTVRPVFTQFSSNAILQLLSDGADTRTIAVTGRNAAGEYVTENMVMTGATPVNSVNTYERILTVIAATTDATRTITAKQGAAGAAIATIPPNEKGFCALFINSTTPASASTVRYEKIFWYNSDATLSLTTAQIQLTADPSAKIQVGVAATLGDTATIANRVAVPAGITFVGVGVAQNVPNAQNLTAATGVGVWIQQTLASTDNPIKSTFTTQLSGNTI